ncbi:MAG: type II toxin-antitoxin system antitoxin SocA domain-containing protein [Cuniculiplasma sp.]
MISGIDLVKYLLKEYGPLPQKKLQKLAYLAEIGYIKKHGERLTDLSFKRYYFGPYSDDIRNIEDLDENIIVSERQNVGYIIKESKLSNPRNIEPIKSKALREEIHSLIGNHSRSSGNILEKVADNTEPFLETDKLNDPIDLDGYAWYCSKINSPEFWKGAEEADKKNEENHVYGKHVIHDSSELDSLFQ